MVLLALVISVYAALISNENVYGTRADLRLRRLLSSGRAVIYLRSRIHQCYVGMTFDATDLLFAVLIGSRLAPDPPIIHIVENKKKKIIIIIIANNNIIINNEI